MEHKEIKKIKSYKRVYPQIYSYILPKLLENEGAQKIGYTEREDVEKRIVEQTHTAAFQLEHKTLWHAPSFFRESKKNFTDKDFHKFLIKSGIQQRKDLGTEWFFFNGYPEKSKELFNTLREKGFSALQDVEIKKTEYTLRDEQEEAIVKAKAYFEKKQNGEFLWNAKPRFGKTLACYDLAKRLEAKKVLIVTNRPAIANSWFDDYEQFIDGYAFISETRSLKDRPTITRDQHYKDDVRKPHFTFLSLQDLKQSIYFGGHLKKLEWIAGLDWDLLIIDEAHEGIDTGRTNAAFTNVKRKHTLHLSGTPFKQLANEKFPKEAIFNWTYLDEQKAKQIEIEEGETGQHTDLPDLKLFTYRISQMITDQVNQGVEIDDENHDYAFDLNQFFATNNSNKFIHEEEVKGFLKNLSTNEKYPFSTPELRNELKHTFWYVGNRVNSVKALEKLLKEDSIFKDYKVVVAAGDGRTFEEEENDFKGNEDSYEKVKKAISENEKTITLSCGQLTTGVTVKEWTAVLMLTDIKTPSVYMQAAFRAQNPFKEYRNGDLYVKESAYLFDFAPTRVLEIYDNFANGLDSKAVKGEITESERKDNIKELLNFFPVISEDINGQMVELDAEKVLAFPNALAASEIVNAHFMTNLLFNDNVKGVFNFPKEVEEIINKMSVEKNKRAEKAKTTLDLDEARTVEQSKQKKINENTEIILGEKIFRNNTDRVVDNLLGDDGEITSSEKLISNVSEIAEPLIAKYKEVYKTTSKESDQILKQAEEKIKVIAEEYNNLETKNPTDLKEKIKDLLEIDLVTENVVQKEDEVVEKVQKTKEEEIRDRLRSFTRTIPMFVMANSSRQEITIDNFDEEIEDKDFVDLTNITKEEFHKLRDGFNYEENGERKEFKGVFNKYRFNASIAEFQAKKEKLSNYFTSDEDIFELIPNQKNNQIFTPRNVVKMMINKLEEQDPSLFTRTDSTFIDLYMKSGMYVTELVKKLFAGTRDHYNSDNECLKHILENQVYGLAPTQILHDITQSYIFGFDFDRNISRDNFAQYDITPEAKSETAKEKLQELFNLNKDMKFDAVVGNPPYQESIEKTENQSQGNSSYIYYYFQNIADNISKKSCLIYPFGGWFDSPKRFGEFGKKILTDRHTVSIYAYEGTTDRRAWYRTDKDPDPLFGVGANLSAGVVIVMREFIQKQNHFLYYNRIYSDKTVKVSFDDWEVLTPNPEFMEWKKILKGDKLKSRIRKGIFGIESNFVEKNPKKVSFQESDWKNPIQLLTNDKSGSAGRATMFWAERDVIEKGSEYIDLYKVVITSAYPKQKFSSGKPTIENVQQRAKDLVEILPKGSAFGASRLSLFMSNDKKECENFVKYTQTRLFAFMLLQEPNQRSTIGSVILDQDFSSKSDIDWSQSIKNIDQQLYEKYKLNKNEINVIENHD